MTAQLAKPRSRRRTILTACLLVIVVLGLAGFVYGYYRANRFVSATFRDDTRPPVTEFGETPTVRMAAGAQPTASATTGPLTPPVAATPQPSAAGTQAPVTATLVPYGNSPVIQRLKAGDRVTILLLGFGGPGHDGGYLTDSIQVLSFDPKTNTVSLISVPRDLWVFIPSSGGRGGYWGKVNEAYSAGMGHVDRNDTNVPYAKHEAGGQLAMKTIAQIIGMPIDYWISMDFVGFRQFIEAIGGVDVNVEHAFTDYQYPNNDDATVDPSYRTVHFDAGLQHMDGEQAIVFARSRYSSEDGNDFNRSRRQQLLMRAVKEQVFRVETLPKLLGILDAFEGHLRMSFTFTEARDLIGWAQEQARARQQYTINTGVLEVGTLFYSTTSGGGAYIIVPRAGEGNYSAVHSFVQDVINGKNAAAAPTPAPAATPVPATPAR